MFFLPAIPAITVSTLEAAAAAFTAGAATGHAVAKAVKGKQPCSCYGGNTPYFKSDRYQPCFSFFITKGASYVYDFRSFLIHPFKGSQVRGPYSGSESKDRKQRRIRRDKTVIFNQTTWRVLICHTSLQQVLPQPQPTISLGTISPVTEGVISLSSKRRDKL